MKQDIVDQVRAAGGEIYAITSEPQHLANQAHEDWGLTFENVGDPHQEISQVCSERGWLTLYANRGDTEFLQRGAEWKVEHPKGYFQPGVLAITNEHRLLYRWRSVPSEANLHGTLARPTATHVWNAVQEALSAGDTAADAALDDDPVIDAAPPPRALFIAALLANGWFIRVKSLVYSPGVEVGPSRWPKILSRWLVFIAFWAIALWLLPAVVVGLGFAAWLAWVVRDTKRVMGKLQLQKELVADKPS